MSNLNFEVKKSGNSRAGLVDDQEITKLMEGYDQSIIGKNSICVAEIVVG